MARSKKEKPKKISNGANLGFTSNEGERSPSILGSSDEKFRQAADV